MAGLDGGAIGHLSDARALDGGILPVGRGKASCPAVEVPGCAVVSFRPPVAELRRHVAFLSGQVALMSVQIPRSGRRQFIPIGAALTCSRPRARGWTPFTVRARRITPPGGSSAILGGVPAIADGKGAVAGSVGARGRGPVAGCGSIFAATLGAEVPGAPGFDGCSVEDSGGSLPCRGGILPIRRHTLMGRSVQVSRGVVAGLCPTVAQFGGRVALVRGEVALEPIDVSVATCRRDVMFSVSLGHWRSPPRRRRRLASPHWLSAPRRLRMAVVTRLTRSRGANGLTM